MTALLGGLHHCFASPTSSGAPAHSGAALSVAVLLILLRSAPTQRWLAAMLLQRFTAGEQSPRERFEQSLKHNERASIGRSTYPPALPVVAEAPPRVGVPVGREVGGDLPPLVAIRDHLVRELGLPAGSLPQTIDAACEALSIEVKPGQTLLERAQACYIVVGDAPLQAV